MLFLRNIDQEFGFLNGLVYELECENEEEITF